MGFRKLRGRELRGLTYCLSNLLDSYIQNLIATRIFPISQVARLALLFRQLWKKMCLCQQEIPNTKISFFLLKHLKERQNILCRFFSFASNAFFCACLWQQIKNGSPVISDPTLDPVARVLSLRFPPSKHLYKETFIEVRNLISKWKLTHFWWQFRSSCHLAFWSIF